LDDGFAVDVGQLGEPQRWAEVVSVAPKPFVTGWQALTGTAVAKCMLEHEGKESICNNSLE
jgi:hypothetical protein